VQAASPSAATPPPCELSLRSFPFPPPQYSSPSNCHSVEVYPSSPSATIPSTSPLSLFPRSEQPPSSRFRPIAPRPALATSTPASRSPPAPICQSIGPVSANLSSISHSASVQPTLPLHTLPHSAVGSSTVEPSETGPHNRRTHQYFREPATSILSTERPAALTSIPQSRQSTIENQTNPRCIVDQALQLLHDELQQRQLASGAFPPLLSPAQIRASVSRYEEHIKAAAENGVCSSCGKFVPISDIIEVNNNDPLLQPLYSHLDHCAKHRDDWDLCLLYLKSLSQNTLPRFSALNRVNMTLCQNYPSVLEDLTPVKECLIAKCHPLGIIIKLRPGR
jgi:hypothetical protein